MLTEIIPRKDLGGNELFPIFINLQGKRLLIIGGGQIGLEKVQTLLTHAPQSQITVLAGFIREEIHFLKLDYPQLILMEKMYHPEDLCHGDLVIVAANDIILGERIRKDIERTGKLINVADKPELCDFYLGAVVKKGNLKIAISTNGKSPTIAKRLKENLNELLPPSMDQILNQMSVLRKGLGGDFEDKINQLNQITKVLAKGEKSQKNRNTFWYPWVALFFLFLGWGLSYILSPAVSLKTLFHWVHNLDPIVYWMFLTGFCAQMVNGALGMGYGVITTLILLFLGIKLPAISGSIHTAELFSSGIGGVESLSLKKLQLQAF